MLVEILDTWIPMCGRIIAISEDPRVRDVKRQEVLEPHPPVIRRPCLLPVAVEAMDSDNAWKELFQNAVIRRRRNGLDSLYLRIHPFNQ
jgi:hypothetical protein